MVTPPDQLNVVLEAMEAQKLAAKGSSLAYLPKTKKQLEGRDAEVALNLADALDDHDDVQKVYSDFDVSDEEMERLGGGGAVP